MFGHIVRRVHVLFLRQTEHFLNISAATLDPQPVNFQGDLGQIGGGAAIGRVGAHRASSGKRFRHTDVGTDARQRLSGSKLLRQP